VSLIGVSCGGSRQKKADGHSVAALLHPTPKLSTPNRVYALPSKLDNSALPKVDIIAKDHSFRPRSPGNLAWATHFNNPNYWFVPRPEDAPCELLLTNSRCCI
jgi:hypothetical protein